MNLRAACDGPDFYPTPAWAVRGLLAMESFNGVIHEPCCGRGCISKELEANGYKVISSDIYDYGFGASGIDARTLVGPVENVVTNPPYNLASELLPRLLSVGSKKIALLLRLAFLESKKRFEIFKINRPSKVYVFSERLSMAPYGQIVNGGGTISHGWFIWDKDYHGPTILDWIPPGFKTSSCL